LSVVANRLNPEQLLVRARMAGDIERLFPTASVFEDLEADYRYRAFLPRKKVASVLAQQVQTIEYDNFKNSVPKSDTNRQAAYLNVWTDLRTLQS
jgi:hypothetical protein